MPESALYQSAWALGLAQAGRFDEADEHDLRARLAVGGRSALSGVRGASRRGGRGSRRGGVVVDDREHHAASDRRLARARRVWTGDAESRAHARARAADSGRWRNHVAQALIPEQYFYVLLWQERFERGARPTLWRSLELLEQVKPAGPVWRERAGDAAFLRRRSRAGEGALRALPGGARTGAEIAASPQARRRPLRARRPGGGATVARGHLRQPARRRCERPSAPGLTWLPPTRGRRRSSRRTSSACPRRSGARGPGRCGSVTQPSASIRIGSAKSASRDSGTQAGGSVGKLAELAVERRRHDVEVRDQAEAVRPAVRREAEVVRFGQARHLAAAADAEREDRVGLEDVEAAALGVLAVLLRSATTARRRRAALRVRLRSSAWPS